MTDLKDGKPGRTVLLAADVCSYSAPVINLAVEIAASAGSRLQGMFFEDEELLDLLQSPSTREISLMTASAMPTDGERMQRMLRSVSRQFESTLEREAQALKITWSYEYVRGRMQDIGLKAPLDVEITILGRTGLYRVESARRGRSVRVLVIGDLSARQMDALEIVMRRFGGGRKELTLVTNTPNNDESREIRRRIGAREPQLTFAQVQRSDMFDLLRRSGQSYDYAVLPMRDKSDELALILKALKCPVILVA
jgi:hypothetical protein